jgi:tRNA G18 (ribose-2'-O)-methylase SpoU
MRVTHPGGRRTIDDPADPRLADYAGLRDPERRRRVERKGGFFIVEGAIAIRALLRSRYPVRSLLVTERQAAVLADEVAPTPVYVARREVMAALVGFDFHRGALASADRLSLPDPVELVQAGPALIAVVEGVNDHENLGALFRNAAAFGVGAALLDPSTADPLYRRSVRVSLGHVLHVPFARVTPWPERLGDLRDLGYEIVALTPDRDAEPIDRLADDAADRIAILLGAEGTGLSAVARSATDRRVRIPMAAGVDSLNVATAAAIAFHRLSGQDHPSASRTGK